MKKLLGILVLGLFLQGCGIGGAYFTTDKNRYIDTPVSTLCIGYYESLITGNIHATPKREMIEERGIDCRPYKEEGVMKGEATNAYYESLKGNLEHLGSNSASESLKRRTINCRTRTVGGYTRTFCY
jgi:hypothetical protein